jgi:CheY-like chemotaxis protein
MNRSKEHKLNVIIADDDMDDQLFMQKAIWEENLHHTITSVYNGQQLVDLLMRNGFYNKYDTVPDCIFLDLKMPLLSGFDVLNFIKNHNTFNTIPVYILSTTLSETQKLKLILLGADGFYQKETGYNAMKNTINDILYMVYSAKGIRMNLGSK